MSEDKGTDAHIKLLRQFEEAFDSTQDARRDAERDRDYYDGTQYTDEELETLRQRKQPVVVSNRIKPKIDALLGFAKKKQMQPKAYPRTPQHEQDAHSVTDAVRFACDQARFDAVRMDAAEHLFIEGIAAATVTVIMRGGQPEIQITHVPWDRFYYDPHSRKRDYSDAGYKGVVLWMDEEEAKWLAGDSSAVVDGCYGETDTGEGETYDDRPKVTWADKKRKRIRVLQHRYLKGGKWWTAIVCKGGFLRPAQVSPYLNEHGEPECDLIAGSAYIDRENNRYGDVRQMISPQDEINKRRSKALHLLNSQKIIADFGAVSDVEQTRREMAKPDGYAEVMPNSRFDVVEQQALVQGQFQLLQEAKNEIDASGVDPALSGDTQAPSGRSQEMLTQMGLAEKEVTFTALQDFCWRVYRATWNRIRQYWTEERWIRVTDDERNLKWVALNQQTTDPETGHIVKQNQISQLDVDIVLEDGPDSVTIQAEQYEQLVELKKADPSIPTAMVVEASQLRNKEKLLEHLEKGGIPPQVQQQMQEMQESLQQCQQQLQQAEQDKGREKQEAQAIKAQVSADIKVAQADIAKERAEMALQHAQWQMEQMVRGQEQQIQAYQAETDRIQALRPEPQPQTEQ
jgi:hypothetical protein